jgi:hypothetical protein
MVAILNNSGHLEIIKGYQIAKIPFWLNSMQWDLSFDISHDTLQVTFWFCTWWLNSTHRDLPFDMSHDTLQVTFCFCTQWPWNTPGLNSTHQDLSFDMSHDTLRVSFYFALNDPGTPPGWILLIKTFHLIYHTIPFSYFLILHSLTLEHPWDELYLSRPFIWYVTWYPLSNFLILHSMTLEHPRAELYSSRPWIWYVTWYRLSNFLFALDDPRTPLGWPLPMESFLYWIGSQFLT